MAFHIEYFVMLSLILSTTMTESRSVNSGLLTTLFDQMLRFEERLEDNEESKQISSCPNGWLHYKNRCYIFAADVNRTFIEAKTYCGHLDSQMLQVETEEENNFIKEYLQGLKDNHYWIGLSDIYDEGVWRWSALGDVPSFTDWAPGEPNSYGDQDCVLLFFAHDYRWVDFKCKTKTATACEMILN